jgi:virulence-associated protein VapD
VAFDLTVVETEKYHPKGISQAYSEIGDILGEYGFRRLQGSLYVSDDENMANLFLAIQTLAAVHGSQNRCVTSVHSGSSSGRTLLQLSRE